MRKLFLVCTEDNGHPTSPILFRNKEDAVDELRRRFAFAKKENGSVEWVENGVCFDAGGIGWTSLSPVDDYGYGDSRYILNLDEGGSVSNVEAFESASCAEMALADAVESWNAEEDSEYRMEPVDGEYGHYDDGCGFGYIITKNVKVI